MDSSSEDEPKDGQPVLTINSSDSSTDNDEGTEEIDPNTMAAQTQPQPRRKRFIPKYDVEGVYKVVLGEETQIQIDMVVGKNISAQFPWKMVEKKKIIDCVDASGDSSEFHPLIEEINLYPEDEILMGFIVDESKDVDEFYICCTVAARDHCKQQSDKFIKRQEKKLKKAVEKKARPWKSLGSELELSELVPKYARSLVEVEIKSKFPKEYEPSFFKARDTNVVRDGYIELTPYRQTFNNVFKRRVDCATQAACSLANRHAQTDLKYPKNMWSQSIADTMGSFDDKKAGGDTGDMGDIQEKEELSSDDEDENAVAEVDEVGQQAYERSMKRLRRLSYIKTLNNFVAERKNILDPILELNTVMDMYHNDYIALISETVVDIYDTMKFEEYVCFSDVRAKNKYISSAVFHPMWTGVVAICYSDKSPVAMKKLSIQQDQVQRDVYGLNPVLIWSHVDSLIPKLYLKSPREVRVLSFCPFNENILIGGCVNGQIVVWDLTNKLENTEKVEVLNETTEKYRIAMNAHMHWMKNIQDNSVVESTALSNLLTSHYGPVYAISWLSPNFNVSPTGRLGLMKEGKSIMFFSASEDGNILIWNLSVENVVQFDMKKVKKSKRVPVRPAGLLLDISPFKILDRTLQPCYKIVLGTAGAPQIKPLQCFAMNYPTIRYVYAPRTISTGRKYFTPEIVPQSADEINPIIYIGTQHGELAKISWDGHDFNTGELINSEYANNIFSCFIHDGIITCTEKNPFMEEITLTVGGKVFAIWTDKLQRRPLFWKKRTSRITYGKWSLYKPSLIFITTSEGDLEIWDLLVKTDNPISVQTLSGNMLTGISLHTLPIPKNMIGVSDVNGSFRIFLNPPIFMIQNNSYLGRMQTMILRELKVLNSFIIWQDILIRNNPEIIQERKRKEGELLALKEEEKKAQREEEERRLEEEAEARRLESLKVIGPAERWQKIIQKLIEKTIAVKKRINKEELLEQEKPLRQLEKQRIEKERRMLEIMKNQKAIFNDTVAILFPEAIKKETKVKKSHLSDDKESLKKEYYAAYKEIKRTALNTVQQNPYKVAFCWDGTLGEGRERKQTLHAHQDYIMLHRSRLENRSPSTHIETPAPANINYPETNEDELNDEALNQ